MKLKIDKSVLQHELGRVRSLVDKTSNMMQAALDAANGKLRISATNFNVTSISTIDAPGIEEEGSTCVPSAKLHDILRLLKDGDVSIKSEPNHWVTVKKERARYKLPGIDPAMFPELPPLKPTGLISIPSADLLQLLQRTEFVVPNKESTNYSLNGIKLVIDGTTIKAAATDGMRLASVEGTLSEESLIEVDTILPDEAVLELIRLLSDYDGPVNIALGENHLYFRCAEKLLISRLLVGKFPDYEKMFAKGELQTVEFDTEELTNCIRRTAVVATNRAVVLKFENGELLLSSASYQEGLAHEVIPIESDLSAMISFDYKLMLDFLDKCSSERVAIDLLGSDKQATFRPARELTSYRYVLMPVRLPEVPA